MNGQGRVLLNAVVPSHCSPDCLQGISAAVGVVLAPVGHLSEIVRVEGRAVAAGPARTAVLRTRYSRVSATLSACDSGSVTHAAYMKGSAVRLNTRDRFPDVGGIGRAQFSARPQRKNR